jgi:hypothetical protein
MAVVEEVVEVVEVVEVEEVEEVEEVDQYENCCWVGRLGADFAHLLVRVGQHWQEQAERGFPKSCGLLLGHQNFGSSSD